MPFETERDETYIVQSKNKDEGWQRDGCLGMVILIGVMCLISVVGGMENKINNMINIAVFAVSVSCFCWLFMRKKPVMQISVHEEGFCVVDQGKCGPVYAFDQITKVNLYYPLVVGPRHVSAGRRCWRIFIGDQCVAAFSVEMENGQRLLKKLDDLGLITPYATGEK